MRRYLGMLFILIVLSGCRLRSPEFSSRVTPMPAVTITILPPINTTTDIPSLTPSKTPTPTASPTLTSSPTPELGFTVEYHPDGPLFIGDLVSISVIAPLGVDMTGEKVSITIHQPALWELQPLEFSAWGIEGRTQATSIWGWDTSGLEAGDFAISYSIKPLGYTFTDTVTLLPISVLPAAEVGAHWAQAQTACCEVHYITGTAAERDLQALLFMIDQQIEHATQAMGIEFTQTIVIAILPRVLGHGGFTSDEIYVSYLDRNYAANSWEMVVHHEMIHMLDNRLGGELRPTMLVEGLAVYLSGGHYKPEALLPRAAALLEEYTGFFIPLDVLAQDFYAAQHEISYLEAGALVEYLVNTYSWEKFSSFYRDIHPIASGSQVDALEVALEAHFDQSLSELQINFKNYLRLQTEAESWQSDVTLTVSYFDTLRRYQQLLDRSAYFRTAWLLDGVSMRSQGIVADWLRHPSEPANLSLETMLISASDAMVNGDTAHATELLLVVNQVLEGVERGVAEPFSANPLATDYLEIATTLQQAGYLLQSVELNGETANALVTAEDMDLIELQLIRESEIWRIY